MNRAQATTRVVPFGRNNNAGKFTNNQIFTTKYSYLSFIPHAIILQFLYPRNFIFLANAILQSIRAISNLSPWTAILPLIVVIFISVLREGWQDYKRRRRDWRINLKEANVLKNGNFVKDTWQNIQVGDFVAVLKKEEIPADIILLQTSEENGVAYVETSNLDGERNLKTKTSIFQNNKLYPVQLEQLQGVAEVELPNTRIHQFQGIVGIDQKYTIPVSQDNVLLRGTSLQNIDEAIGLVIYTGMDTKIMMNLGNVRNKVNRFQTMINWIQLILAIFLFFMVLTCGLVYWRIWRDFNGSEGIFYLFRVHHYGVHGEAAFASLSSFILLNTIIPLSLNISLDLIAAFQSDVFEYDIRMSHLIQNKRIYCTVNNSRTIPELGIVSFVLTDKTGTLTSNQLEFKGLYVDRQAYYSHQLMNSRMDGRGGGFSRFWLMVLVCNDVIIDHQTNEYQGSSNDELCLLNFAAQLGYKLIRRQRNQIIVSLNGQQKSIQIIHIIPFDERKMMSVIMRDPSTRQCVLCIKGADNEILQRSRSQNEIPQYDQQVKKFSREGLRTLVFATRIVNQSQISNFVRQISALKQRKFRGEINRKQYRMLHSQSMNKIQNNLDLLGATAIEDKLQEGVSESIRSLRIAGIQIAMITGDKLETAQNIGYLSNFIDQQSQIIKIVQASTPQNQLPSLVNKMRMLPRSGSQYSIIIQGKAIPRYINHPDVQIQQGFADIVEKCSSVIFCRASPQHKGFIAMFYKKYYQGVVVAIGDGGNDVRMIQQADIGIGIEGKQGNQASSSADFSIGRFRFIERLILHHGRWVLFRMAFFFNYYGFKVTLITMVLFCYLAYAGFSGTSLLPNAYLAAYNSVLTVVLPIGYAVYEHDISADLYQPASYYLPLMYKDSKRLQLFSYWRFALWTIVGIVYAVWLFFTTYYVLDSRTATDNHGRIPDQMSVAMNIQMSLYIFVTSVIIMQIHAYNLWMWFLVLFLTFIIAIIFFIIQNYAYVDDAYQALTNNFNLRFWLLILLNSVLGTAIRYLMLALNFTFWPSSIEIAMLQRNYLPYPMVNRQGHSYNQLELKSYSIQSSGTLI